MNPTSPTFRRLHLLQDVGPLEHEIAQEQATSLGRLGRALELALAELRAFDEAQGVPDTAGDAASRTAALPPERRAERAALRDRAGHVLWQFVVQRESCGLRDVRQMMRDYRVPAEVQMRMGAMTGAMTGAAPDPAKPPTGR